MLFLKQIINLVLIVESLRFEYIDFYIKIFIIIIDLLYIIFY